MADTAASAAYCDGLIETDYDKLEECFRTQVLKDRIHLRKWVEEKGLGVYLPCERPKNKVDYIFVGMEPSFGWADNVEEAEKRVRDGEVKNFGSLTVSDNATDPLDLLKLSIERFLCRPGETFFLTDVSKGAMPVTIAANDREQRYERWYPLLLKEIQIVGKPGVSIIAIGDKVQQFLNRKEAERDTGRTMPVVMHYSRQAVGHWKREAEKDPEGFEAFKKKEFIERNRWAKDLPTSKMQLIFTYKKQLTGIRG